MDLKEEGNAAYKAGKFVEAYDRYSAALAVADDDGIRLNRMSAAMAIGWLTHGFDDGRAVLQRQPKSEKAMLRMANLLLTSANSTAAASLLSHVTTVDSGLRAQHSKSLETVTTVSALEAKLSLPLAAIAASSIADCLRPAPLEATLAANTDCGVLADILHLVPQAPVYAYAFALRLVATSRLDAALSVLSALARQLSEASGCSVLPAASLAETGELAGIKTQAVSIPELTLPRAQLLVALGTLEAAVAEVMPVVRSDPEGATTAGVEALHFVKQVKSLINAKAAANELYRAGKFAEALAAYTELQTAATPLLGFTPSFVYANIAAALLAMERHDAALEQCNAALRVYPFQAKLWMRRATCIEKIRPVQQEALLTSLFFAQCLSPEDTTCPAKLFSVSAKMDEEAVSDAVGSCTVVHPEDDTSGLAAVFHPRSSSSSSSLWSDDAPAAPKRLLVVDVFATWCGPCKAIAPAVERLAPSYPLISVIKIDGDKCPETARRLNARAYPTFVTLLDGVEIGRMEGADAGTLHSMVSTGLTQAKVPRKFPHASRHVALAAQCVDLGAEHAYRIWRGALELHHPAHVPS